MPINPPYHPILRDLPPLPVAHQPQPLAALFHRIADVNPECDTDCTRAACALFSGLGGALAILALETPFGCSKDLSPTPDHCTWVYLAEVVSLIGGTVIGYSILSKHLQPQ